MPIRNKTEPFSGDSAALPPSAPARILARRIALTVCITSAGLMAGASAGPRGSDGACGSAGARFDIGYPNPDSSDTDGHCEGDIANYEGTYKWAIGQMNATRGTCEEIRVFLLYDATLFEWTGWVDKEYLWDAGTWETRIGVHWPWMSSAWLLTNQGARAVFRTGDIESNALADMCSTFDSQ